MFALEYERALPLVREAQRRGLATERLSREARRMEALLLVGTRRLDEAERRLREWQLTSPSRAIQAEIEDWLARIAWERRNP